MRAAGGTGQLVARLAEKRAWSLDEAIRELREAHAYLAEQEEDRRFNQIVIPRIAVQDVGGKFGVVTQLLKESKNPRVVEACFVRLQQVTQCEGTVWPVQAAEVAEAGALEAVAKLENERAADIAQAQAAVVQQAEVAKEVLGRVGSVPAPTVRELLTAAPRDTATEVAVEVLGLLDPRNSDASSANLNAQIADLKAKLAEA